MSTWIPSRRSPVAPADAGSTSEEVGFAETFALGDVVEGAARDALEHLGEVERGVVGAATRRHGSRSPRPLLGVVVVRQIRHREALLEVDVRRALDPVGALEHIIEAQLRALPDAAEKVDLLK